MLSRALQPKVAELARFTAVAGRMWSSAWSPDGKRIVTTDDKAAQVWDAVTYQRLLLLPHGDTVYDARYTPDGQRIVSACGDGYVRIWDAASGALLRDLSPKGARPRYFLEAVSPDGELVAAIDINGLRADVWEIGTGTLRTSVDLDGSGWPSLAVSPDGRWLAASGGNDARIFDAATGQIAATIAGPHIRTLSFDPRDRRIATATSDGNVSLWAVPAATLLRSLREGTAVETLGPRASSRARSCGLLPDGWVSCWTDRCSISTPPTTAVASIAAAGDGPGRRALVAELRPGSAPDGFVVDLPARKNTT
jgi:WD40 repeat protein